MAKKQASGDEPLKQLQPHCGWCGKPFSPADENQQFCSSRCEDAALDQNERCYADGSIGVADFYDD